MRLIDDRGRLFGRLNIIDGFLLLLVLGLLPLGYGAFALFRPPELNVTGVTPSQIVEGDIVTVHLTGRDLRALLTVVATTGVYVFQAGPLIVHSATDAEFKTPLLPPGAFDLRVMDGGQQVARVHEGLTVVPRPTRTASVRVRLFVLPEIADHVHAGDANVASGSADNAGRVVLADVARERQPVRGILRDGLDPQAGADKLQVEQELVALTATVRMPVTAGPSGWQHAGRAIKAGAPFTFESASGIMHGWILDVQLQ